MEAVDALGRHCIEVPVGFYRRERIARGVRFVAADQFRPEVESVPPEPRRVNVVTPRRGR